MSKKLTKSQIREHERQKLVKQLERKYSSYIDLATLYKELWHKTTNELGKLRQEYDIIKGKNAELEESVRNYKDWVRRMQEFMDLPEEQRSEAFKEYCDSMKSSKRFHDMTDAYISMIDRFFVL
jgi:hypothetical protein